MPFVEEIVKIIAPNRCLACGVIGDAACEGCMFSEMSPPPSRCYRCYALTSVFATCQRCRRASKLSHVWVGSEYVGLAENLVKFIKFERGRSAAAIMAGYLSAILPVLPEGVIFVHVPTASSRVRIRGYDQSKLLAEGLAKSLNKNHKTLLSRSGQTRQVGTGRQQRLKQLEDAFRPINKDLIKGAHLVLVDDVLTTGATLEAAAKVLKQAGAKKIDAVVFAQA